MNEIKNRDEILSINIKEFHFNKVKDDLSGGDHIKIYWFWNNFKFEDEGYCFELPGHATDELDIFIHIPKPFSEGKSQPIWIHMYDLLTNDDVIKIEKLK